VTCGTEEALGDVLRATEYNRISCVVVMDEERRPRGIFTERVAVALLAGDEFAPAIPISEVVSFPLSFDYRDAYQPMLANDVHPLGAVDGEGRVAGVMIEADFLADFGDEYPCRQFIPWIHGRVWE
jgi:CBS domain-containing protein